MEFRILGPLEVMLNGEPIDLGGVKPRTVLAMLLLRRNQVVSRDKLSDQLWGNSPPATAHNIVQTYVSHLRAALEPARPRDTDPQLLLTRPPGYLLRVTDDQLDATRFERLLQEGTAALASGRADLAITKLQAGLKLWRGSALADFPDAGFAKTEIARLEGLRLVAGEHTIAADFALGRHRELVGPLEVLIQKHPRTESLRYFFMLALYRSSRQADALRAYEETRALLREELGIDPSIRLQRLHQAILRQSPELDWHPEGPQELPFFEPRRSPPAATPDKTNFGAGRRAEPDRRRRPQFVRDRTSEGGGPVVPSPHRPAPGTARADLFQLPPDVGDFVEREDQSAQLRTLLEREGRHPSAVVVSAISGKAGVGKSALTIHIAHEVKHRFPDAQLYVNLRGLDTPVPEPADVLADFLLTLGVDPASIPDGLGARARLYRARLRGRRVLVVLDNAANEAQVRPLLPWSEECAVLVSSRRRLAGLEGAVNLELDVMEPRQAVELLGKVTGQERVAAEPKAADEIVRLCGYLPLAVRIAGARLAAKSHWRLGTYAARLQDERRYLRLKELRAGDLEVRASFALNYEELSADEQRAFRLLGTLDIPDFPVWVAAALMDCGLDVAEERVEQLVDAQLVEAGAEDQTGQIRYRFHDLLRAFARDCLEIEEPAESREAALERALSAYLEAILRCGIRLGFYPVADSRMLRSTEGGYSSLTQVVDADPLAWLSAEQHNLIAAVAQAHDAGLWQLCWELADSLAVLFEYRPEWSAWEHANELALNATRQAADREVEAYILLSIGKVHRNRRGPEAMVRADPYFDEALATFAELGDRRGTAYARLEIGATHRYHGRFQDALTEFEQCLPCFARSRTNSAKPPRSATSASSAAIGDNIRKRSTA